MSNTAIAQQRFIIPRFPIVVEINDMYPKWEQHLLGRVEASFGRLSNHNTEGTFTLNTPAGLPARNTNSIATVMSRMIHAATLPSKYDARKFLFGGFDESEITPRQLIHKLADASLPALDPVDLFYILKCLSCPVLENIFYHEYGVTQLQALGRTLVDSSSGIEYIFSVIRGDDFCWNWVTSYINAPINTKQVHTMVIRSMGDAHNEQAVFNADEHTVLDIIVEK